MRYTLSTFLMLLFSILQLLSSVDYFSGIHIIFFLWLISTFLCYRIDAWKILTSSKYKLLYVFFIFYFLSQGFAAGIPVSFARVVAMAENLSPIYMFDLYRINKWNGQKYPFYVFIVVFIVNMSLSFSMIEFMGDSGLRDVVQSDSDNKLKGAFNLIYSLALIIPTVIYVLRNLKEIRLHTKILVLVASSLFCFFAFMLVFKAFFMTALVTAILGSMFALIYGMKYWWLKGIIVMFAVLMFFLTFFSPIVSFVDNISYGASKQLTPKLYELKYTFTGEGHNADDLTSRNNLAASSLRVFYENPIFGVSYLAKNFEDTIKLGVGNHSEWLDSLALFGLFSLLLYTFLYKSFRKQFCHTGFSLPILLFIFLGFNNPMINFSSLCTIFILIPLYFDIINFDRNGNSNCYCSIQ